MPSKRTIPRVCRHCGADFLAGLDKINRGGGLYCSTACFYVRQCHPTIFVDDGTTAMIPLCAQDGSLRAYTAVDAADSEWVNQWRWSLHPKGYAQRSVKIGGRVTTVRLNRALLGLVSGDGLEGDHIDRDKCNNRRGNLRIVPKGKNIQNQPSHRGASSAFRGVSWSEARSKWSASVRANGRDIHLGFFIDEHEAGEAARAARARLLPYATD